MGRQAGKTTTQPVSEGEGGKEGEEVPVSRDWGGEKKCRIGGVPLLQRGEHASNLAYRGTEMETKLVRCQGRIHFPV